MIHFHKLKCEKKLPHSFLSLFIAISKWVCQLSLSIHEIEWAKEGICPLYYLEYSQFHEK